MIRDYLPWEIAQGRTHGLGMWDGDILVGVAAWSEQGTPLVWRCNVVAVAEGRYRRRLGYDLKRAVIDHARLAGCLVVVSTVHRDNDAMLELNKKKFNATIELDPSDPYRNTMICTIVV